MKSIFYDNVRDFQQYNEVNKEIKETLDNDKKSLFVLMNNGITIISREIKSTGTKMYIEDYQIVNGCQTSHVLYDFKNSLSEEVLIPLRLISTKDQEVINSVIKATNRQTVVSQDQLFALSDFQKKLEDFFATFDGKKRLYYERRSKQYENDEQIEKTRIISMSYLLRAFVSMFLEEPHKTTKSYGSLLPRIGKDIFNTDHKLEMYYVSAYALYKLEYLFRNKTIDRKYRPGKWHILLLLKLKIFTQNHQMNSRDMQKMCERILTDLSDDVKSKNLFVGCIKQINDLIGSDFLRDDIRTQQFTEKIIQKFRPEKQH